jgi:hypothetical protein
MPLPNLIPYNIDCPYCGEEVEILIDGSVEAQSYIEDCQVCCRPMEISVVIDETGEPSVEVAAENDV